MAKETTKKVRTSEQNNINEQFKEIAVQSKKAVQVNEKRLYNRFMKQITTEYSKMENCYLNAAFALHALYIKKLYKVGGYQNIYELAQDKFELSRGTCNNFINICEKFGIPNEAGTITALGEAYKNYGMSQLIVMLNMNDELRKKCNPTMSVRELKELKREYLENARAELEAMEEHTASLDAMNEPEETDSIEESVVDSEAIDISATDNSVFVCSADNYEELLKLKDVIVETLEDVKKNKRGKNARIELNIVF